MTSFTKAALAAALSLGAVAVAGAPATAAQKKEQAAPAAKPLKLSADVRKPAAELDAALKASDFATAKAKLAEVQAVAKTDDEKYFAGVQALQIAAKENNMAEVGNAITGLLANPRTPQEDRAKYHFFRGQGYAQAKNYPAALNDFQEAQKLGYTDANGDLGLRIVQTQFDAGNTAAGLTALSSAIAAQKQAGTKPSEDLYKFGISRAYKANMKAQSYALAKDYLADYPTADNWRTTLVLFRDASGPNALDRPQKIDLFRLMRATKALADQNDYYEYADLAFRAGLPAEAKTVIDAGRAAGKVQTSHSGINGLYADAQASIKNEGSYTALETRSKSAADGKLAAATGDGYLGQGNYAKAVEMYKLSLSKGGTIDQDAVNTHLGIALAMQGNAAEAKTAFAAVKTAPRTDIAGFWTFFLDRGGATTASAS